MVVFDTRCHDQAPVRNMYREVTPAACHNAACIAMIRQWRQIRTTNCLCFLQAGKYVPVDIDHDAQPPPQSSKSPAKRTVKYKPSVLDSATQVLVLRAGHAVAAE